MLTVKQYISSILTCIIFFQNSATAANTNSSTAVLMNPAKISSRTPQMVTPYQTNVAVNNSTTDLATCPSTFNCPDVNGKGGTNDTPSCPNVCTVTRSPSSDTTIINNPATIVTIPMCPAGYAQVYAYNALQEFKLTNLNNITVTNWTLFLQFRTAGFSWSDGASDSQWDSGCVDKSTSFAGAGQQIYWDPNDTSKKFTVVNGQVEHITSVYVNCYSAGCVSGWGYPSFTWADLSGANSGSNPGQGGDCGTGVAKHMYLRVSKISFNGKGNLSTGNYIPGTIVCSREIPTWGGN